MNQLAYDGQGVIGNDMFGLLDPGYPKGIPPRTYDPEKAKALWDKAVPSGTKLQFWTADTLPGQQTAALVFGQQAQAAGIPIEVKTVPASEYFNKAYAVQPFANDYWQAIPVLTNFSEGFLPHAIFSKAAAWSDPTATNLYKQASAETDATKRNELVGELLVLFRDKGPYIVWAFEASPNIYSSRVGGGEPNATGSLNGLQLERFYIKS
jgi:peptide/nickel transport system substrate-binding protein